MWQLLPCFCFRLLNTNYTCCSCEPNISVFSRILLDQVSSRFFMELLLMVSILVYPSRNFFFISAAKGLMHRASVGAPPHKNLYSHIASFQRLYPTPLSPTHHPSSLSLPPGKQKYTCPKCNMQYLMLTVLERHMAKCDGTNPLVCPVCKRTFSQACAVKEHMRGFHGIGEKVACQYCGKAFKYKTSLYTHFCEEKQKQRQMEKQKQSDGLWRVFGSDGLHS